MSKVVSFLTSGTPWAIEKSALETIIGIAQRENNLEAVLKERGEPLDNTHKVQVRNGVAIIPVTGPLFPRANLFGQVSGAYSVEMLAQDLAQTELNADVSATVLMIDSPGGHTTMINEFSNQIANYSKPIVAYVVGQAASAAYWIASATDKIIIDNTAMVGSIGVVAAFSATEKGVIEIVSSNAQDKRPDLSTDAGKAVVQAVVDDMEAVFIQAIMDFRSLTREQVTALRGGVVIGSKAVEQGFADQVGSLESVILELTTIGITMDISKLKADHPSVYKAVFDEGVASANTDAAALKAEGGSVEKTRIGAILNHEAAKGREVQAKVLALDTDMTAEQAAKVLAASPVAQPQAQGDQFSAHMAKLGNPEVGADADDESTATSAAQGWNNAFSKVAVLHGGKR